MEVGVVFLVTGWFSFIMIMSIFGAVLFLAYVTARFLGGKAGNIMKGKNIQVVETISLGLDKQIHLIHVGEKFILLSTAGKSVQMLTVLTPEEMGEIVLEKSQVHQSEQFKEIFEKYVGSIGDGLKRFKKGKAKMDSAQLPLEGSRTISENLANIRAINKKLKITSKGAEDENVYEKTQTK
jgi:flagellar protein FliO/FliZ